MSRSIWLPKLDFRMFIVQMYVNKRILRGHLGEMRNIAGIILLCVVFEAEIPYFYNLV